MGRKQPAAAPWGSDRPKSLHNTYHERTLELNYYYTTKFPTVRANQKLIMIGENF
ncbi:hypothetical protein [Caproiciproducens faecalis]|uniref:Uncharacterized protein n=1 Tax=Caproiciproducens faecalis TaxID=2820301 RepID=A0ABS7DRE5_9FIRM|nr:hypothetical protein [Caproiciproducens faecalis]MBW7573858.1 hypothetical protein [Caproiciproducens faecalis]